MVVQLANIVIAELRLLVSIVTSIAGGKLPSDGYNIASVLYIIFACFVKVLYVGLILYEFLHGNRVLYMLHDLTYFSAFNYIIFLCPVVLKPNKAGTNGLGDLKQTCAALDIA